MSYERGTPVSAVEMCPIVQGYLAHAERVLRITAIKNRFDAIPMLLTHRCALREGERETEIDIQKKRARGRARERARERDREERERETETEHATYYVCPE